MKENSRLTIKNDSSQFFHTFSWIIIPIILLTGVIGVFNKNNGKTNLYTYQAEAFLQGNFAIQEKANKLPGETIEYEGKLYSPFPPFPAIVLTPFVAIFGKDGIKIYWISFTMAVLTSLIVYRTLRGVGIDISTTSWVLAGFVLGTGYWQVFRASEWVWLFAQLTAVLCTFLAIYEAINTGRGWLSGLFAGLAFLSRQLSIYSVIFIPLFLWKNPKSKYQYINIISFFLGVGLCVLLYLGFNYYRFNSIGSGYDALNYETFGGSENILGERTNQYGIFSPAYFIFNFVYMFLQGYHIEFGSVNMLAFSGLDKFGTSLLAASPFVIAAFRAKGEKVTLFCTWAGVVLPLIHALFYHNNGYIQYNMQRFSLDFMPILIILIAKGFSNSSPDLQSYWKGMIIYSIVLNVITNLLPFN